MGHRHLRLLAAAVVVAGAGLSMIGAGTAFAQDTASLSIAPGGSFGAFLPGVARDYTTSLAATATATGAMSELTVHDPNGAAPGYLVNGTFPLPQALQARAASATGTGSAAFAPIGESPISILSWAAPIVGEPVTITLKQPIGATDSLLAGDYGKTLEFTLSSTSPMKAAIVTLLVAAFGFAPATATAQQAPDSQAPEYALGGLRDPAQGVLVLTVSARDLGGSGLLTATATLGGGTPVVCAVRRRTCAADVPTTCPDTGTVELEVPTTSLPDGQHDLDLRVSDVAGNVSAKVERIITVRNTPDVHTSTVTVHVGSGVAAPPRPGGTAPPLAGVRRQTAAPVCQLPRMTMALTRKPLRRQRNGVPVLKAGKSYRFSGRVTCRVGKRRVNAPLGLPIEIYHQVGARKLRKLGTKTRAKGRVAVNLRLYGKRVLIFRVRGTRREIVQVRIRVAVVKR